MRTVAHMAELATLLTTAQVAEKLGKSVATVNRWAADGRLKPAAKAPGIRGAWLFDPADVVEAEKSIHDDEAAS
jgi:predicted site-specific integrase-resolvase